MNDKLETRKFEAESKQLLELMINSIYSTKDIFLRELISNASDALDKLRFEGLTAPELIEDGGELGIRIEVDKEARILTIIDNGIGMSRDELVANVGTIAKSGTKELLAKLKEAKSEDIPAELIGEFGVGFYSCFMVADEVSLVTKRAGEEEATSWISKGDGEYSVGSGSRDNCGTTIALKLKAVDDEDGLEDFAQEWVLKRIVKQYSDFVRYPIVLKKSVTKEVDGTTEESFEDETVNSQKAIWLRAESEVEDKEYDEFYKHVAHDWTEPLTRLSMHVEGRFEYRSLLFIPSHAPMDLYYKTFERGLELYVKNVKIIEKCDQLLPDYLRFVRGVVDSPDLPLNVSREILQHSRQIAQIRGVLTKKVLDKLAQLQTDDEEKYQTFFKEFGAVLKEGISIAPENKDKIAGLLLFDSSADKEKPTTLKDYVSRMNDDQTEIYFLVGESREAIEHSPHLEALREKDVEVLYLTDPVDEFMTAALTEYDGKAIKSVGKGEVELGSDEDRKKAKAEIDEKSKEFTGFLEAVQKELDDTVSEVRLSSRLTSSVACLVGAESDLSPHIERMLRKNKVDVPDHKRVLELNSSHEIVAKLKARYDVRPTDLELADHAQLLHGLALLAEGSPLSEPAKFAGMVAKLFEENL
jgi:molecular chaperone HtpG